MRRINLIFLGFAALAIPSSFIGITEFTKTFDPDLKLVDVCETGVKENWFKHCEYKFQFDLPTYRWDIYDVNEERALLSPYDTSPDTYWISMDYVYGQNNTPDAYGVVMVFDFRDSGYVNFEEYNGEYFDLLQNENYSNFQYFPEDGRFEMGYEYEGDNKVFSCMEIHEKKSFLVYLVRFCKYPEALDADFIQTDIAKFWRSFRYF